MANEETVPKYFRSMGSTGELKKVQHARMRYIQNRLIWLFVLLSLLAIVYTTGYERGACYMQKRMEASSLP